MESNNKFTYIQDGDVVTMEEIYVDQVYLTVPTEWVCVYHKLLVYMADFGKTLVDDCTASCKGNGKNILNCWNLFQSALACKELGKTKEADFFIDYIRMQLENMYGGTNNEVYNGSGALTITDDGKLKAIVTCGERTRFWVDAETGELYEEYIRSKDSTINYTLQGDNLTVNK